MKAREMIRESAHLNTHILTKKRDRTREETFISVKIRQQNVTHNHVSISREKEKERNKSTSTFIVSFIINRVRQSSHLHIVTVIQ